MPYADPEDKKKYQRKYMRQKRHKKEVNVNMSNNGHKKTVRPADIKKYTTPEGLLKAIAEQIAIIKGDDSIEKVTAARTISNLVRTGTQVYEVTELRKQVEEIQSILESEGRYGN